MVIIWTYKSLFMSPKQDYFTFGIPAPLKKGLQIVKERDGVSEAEQIRRAIKMWLIAQGVMKAPRKRVPPRLQG